MRLFLFLFCLIFPDVSDAQSFRDSEQRFITLSKDTISNHPSNVFTFSPAFKQETPFHCVSIAWTENHQRERPKYHFIFSFSKDSIVWSSRESLFFDEHATDIRDQFATNLLFFDKEYAYIKMQVVDEMNKVNQDAIEIKINFFSPGVEPRLSSANASVVEKASCACPQPRFKSRQDWRCPQGPTSPSLTTVSHLIVHHSAGTNVSNDWGAVVLAIWNLHVYTNGWADVGYNWLIAPDGTLFEGRGGGDNVLGAHFCGKNSGTMGVCLIGTYTNVNPPDTMMATLSEIFAWKACQRAIDPNLQSLHTSTGFNLFGISGHRDGCATECPGQKVYDQIAMIRQSTQRRLQSCSSTAVNEMPEGMKWFQIRPNPVGDEANYLDIFISRARPFSYQIINMNGQVLREEKPIIHEGLNSIPLIEGQVFPKGNYLIKLQLGQQIIATSMVVQ
jgi:hypothetical protein